MTENMLLLTEVYEKIYTSGITKETCKDKCKNCL